MKRDKLEYLTCYTGAVKGTSFYTVHEGLGLLMEYNLTDFSYQVLTQITLNTEENNVRVKGMIKKDERLFMSLESNWDILEYDFDSKQLLVHHNKNSHKDGLFAEKTERMFLCGTKLWIFPSCFAEPIEVFDLTTKQFTQRKSLELYLKENNININPRHYLEYATAEDGVIYAIVYQTGYLVSIDLKTETYGLFDIGKNRQLSSINYDGKNYWLSFFDEDTIEKWNPNYGVKERYELNSISKKKRGQIIRCAFEIEDVILIIPTQESYVLLCDKKKGTVTKKEFPKDMKRVHKNTDRYEFYGTIRYQDKILILPYSVSKMIVLDKKKKEIDFIESRLKTADIKKYVLIPQGEVGAIQEIDGYGIREFLLDVVSETEKGN